MIFFCDEVVCEGFRMIFFCDEVVWFRAGI